MLVLFDRSFVRFLWCHVFLGLVFVAEEEEEVDCLFYGLLTLTT